MFFPSRPFVFETTDANDDDDNDDDDDDDDRRTTQKELTPSVTAFLHKQRTTNDGRRQTDGGRLFFPQTEFALWVYGALVP